MAKEYIEKKAVTDEIGRCIADLPETINPDDVRALMYANERGLWDAFLNFINSLPTQEVTPYEEIEGTPQEVTLIPSNEDAQKAADAYIGYQHEIDEGFYVSARRDAYKDGILYERERLMKEAVDAELWRHNGRTLQVSAVLPANSPVKLGDKVKLIVLKEQ